MIVSVEKKYDAQNNPNCYLVTYTDGVVWTVPFDEENRHYQEILLWVAAGNTITDPGE